MYNCTHGWARKSIVVDEHSDTSPGITSKTEGVALSTGSSVGSGVAEQLGTDDLVVTNIILCGPC